MTGPTAPSLEATRAAEREIVAEIEQIPGVLAAAIWLRDPQHVREGFVTGAPGSSIGTLRNAVSDLLHRRALAFRVEDLQIALVDEAAIPLPLWRGRGLVFDRLEVHRADNWITCHAHVFRRGRSATGEAREVDTELGRARAGARAALLAAEQATRGVSFGLEGVHIIDLVARRYVLVSVEAAFGRRVSHLPGVGTIDRSVEDAACLATLSALERWLAW
ncbi:MAG TPA: hypothetical protein VF212_13470 [Longimicrobiales bacterium]